MAPLLEVSGTERLANNVAQKIVVPLLEILIAAQWLKGVALRTVLQSAVVFEQYWLVNDVPYKMAVPLLVVVVCSSYKKGV